LVYYINIDIFILYEVITIEVAIINKDEVGRKYFNFVAGNFYVYNSAFKPEKVLIEKVVVIKDSSVNPKKSFNHLTNGIIGAIVAGVVGVMVVAASSQIKWDVDFDIYLQDGRVLEIRTQSEKLVRELIKYVPQPDPRAKFRKERGR
jgi:hypothetical protein